MRASRPPFHQAKVIQVFRGDARTPMPLHPLERALVLAASLHLCFIAWALGGNAVWAQSTGLVLGLLSLVLAILPRRYDEELSGPQGPFVLHPWSRLLRFPPFWIGLILLAYAAFLPSDPASAQRVLILGAGAWALGCALATGLTRRTAVQTVLSVLAVNGALLALVGILQSVTHAKGILWSIDSGSQPFIATFLHQGQGGAYFNLIAVITLSLAAWHHVRSLRRMDRSSPAPVFAFVGIAVAALVFMNGSRAAIILLAAFLVVSAGFYALWSLRLREVGPQPALTAALAVVGTALLGASAWFLAQGQSGACDYAQVLGGLGPVGALLLALLPLTMLWRALRNGALAQPFGFLFLVGLGLPLAHAAIEPSLQNAAVLTTFCSAFVLLTRWLELETAR